MKNLLIIISSIILYSSINALTLDELKAFYSKTDSYIEDKISYIMLQQSGSVWEYNYTCTSTDYMDSVLIDIEYVSNNAEDTLFSCTTLYRKNRFSTIETDLLNSESDIVILEDYSLYNGHNFADMISDSASINKMDNHYIIRNLGNDVILDSIFIDRDRMPYRIFSSQNNMVFTFNINKYEHIGQLHIPSAVTMFTGTDLLFSIEETSVNIGWK